MLVTIAVVAATLSSWLNMDWGRTPFIWATSDLNAATSASNFVLLGSNISTGDVTAFCSS